MSEQSDLYSVEAIAEAVKGAHFPCSKQDLIQQYGDKEIEFVKGQKRRLRDVIQGLPYNTFNSMNDLKHAFYQREAED